MVLNFLLIMLFLPVSWPDDLLVSNAINYYLKINKLDNTHSIKVFNVIKSL